MTSRKEREFRQYLVDSDMTDMTVKLFLALMNSGRHDLPESLLTDYFGSAPNPFYDRIDEIKQSSVELVIANQELERRLAALIQEKDELNRKRVAASFWKLLDPKLTKKDVPRKTILTILNGQADPKKVPPELFAALPESISFKLLIALIEENPRASKIVQVWLDEPNPWGNAINDDITWFWSNFKKK